MAETTSPPHNMDWSQVEETVRMLNLAVVQIEMSMREGDDSVDTLTNTFTTMAARVQVIEKLAKAQGGDKSEIVTQCEAVSTEMQQAIIAFQFYDKLTQRLSHVSHSLASLAELVGDAARLYNPVEWTLLQEKIKSKYTMPAEHKMFELMMQGLSVDEVLQHVQQVQHNDQDIELF